LGLLFLVGCGFTAHGTTQGPSDAPNPSADSGIDAPSGPPADWWNASWSHRRLITIVHHLGAD